MAQSDSPDDKHEQARDLAEQAMDKLVEGKDDQAGDLIEKSRRIDPSGVQELLEDLEEDAADRGALPKHPG